MKTFARRTVLSLFLLVASPLFAATPSDFYVTMLNRGINDLSLGRNEAAARELRIAAFGLVDSVPHFETAHIYGAIAAARLNRDADARRATQRVVAAERLEPQYASLDLPADIRTEFENIAAKALTAKQLADLRASRPQSTPAASTAPAQTATMTPPRTSATQSPATDGTNGDRDPAPPRQPQKRATKPTTKPTTRPATTPATTPPPTPTSLDVAGRLDAGLRALTNNDLPAARAIYRELLNAPKIDHATMLRVAEGLYRARDFMNTLRAFDKAGPLAKGEEPYRYYLAVAFFETGNVAAAKRELAAVLPFIAETPAVAEYRARIEAASE